MKSDLFYICLCENQHLDNILKELNETVIIKSIGLFEWEKKEENIERVNLSSLKYGTFKPVTPKINVIIYTHDSTSDSCDVTAINSNLKSTYQESILLTSNHGEYEYIAHLFYSIGELSRLLSVSLWNGHIEKHNRDLVAANGWESFEDCFKVANLSNNWVVLRNSEYLPNNFFGNDKDVDILCEDKERFIKIVNAKNRHNGVASYFVKIQGVDVDFDIRYVGDDYYDKNWQKSLLENKKISDGAVPELIGETALYSLLYHAVIHKQEIKAKYLALFSKYFERSLTAEKHSLNFLLNKLDRYMKLSNYKAVYPLDVYCLYSFNYNNVKELKKSGIPRYKFRYDVIKIKAYNFFLKINHNVVSDLIPVFIKRIILKNLPNNKK